VIKQIEVDKPGKGFDGLLYALLEAGMVSSEQILLVPEDVLSVIGDMGKAHARSLRNYAKRVMLHVLDEEPEIDFHDPRIGEPNIAVLADTGYADICDEFLNSADIDEDDEIEVEIDELEDDEEETNETW
jgi:hypothetical protein